MAVGEFLDPFTFILLCLLFIRSQKPPKGCVLEKSNGLGSDENKAVDIVPQLLCFVTPTLFSVLLLCFWAFGK